MTAVAKTQALIVAIFIMLGLSLIGWTIVNFTAVDLEVNSRFFDSETALSLAEAGIEWALEEFSVEGAEWEPDASDDLPHALGKGEYNVSVAEGDTAEEIIVTSTGYIPSQANARSSRVVKVTLIVSSIAKMATVKTYFDWSNMSSGSYVRGDIYVGDWGDMVDYDGFEGDNDPQMTGPHNEENIDYGNNKPNGTGDRVLGSPSAYPTIDMDEYINNFWYTKWPSPLTRDLRANLSSVSTDTIQVGENGFFTGMTGQAVRNLSFAWDDSGDSWAVITNVPPGGASAVLDKDVQALGWSALPADEVKIAKRFYPGESTGHWYVNSDVIFDARSGDVEANGIFTAMSCVAEGDIILFGDNDIAMRAWSLLRRGPLLATQDGDIIGFAPETGNPTQKMNKRRLWGLVYTENGDIVFNYLCSPKLGFLNLGMALAGNNVFLNERIQIYYSSTLVDGFGLSIVPTATYWQED